MPADWGATGLRAVAHLEKALRPINYRELCRLSLVGNTVDYKPKTPSGPGTDHEEKFRQRYKEHYHPDIVVILGGNLALRRWFPVQHRRSLFAPPTSLLIDGNCLVSYRAGYEHAKREPHLKDWYGDGSTEERKRRREDAFLFESHVRAYYQRNWPQFYLPPTNEDSYERPARDDFRLELPFGTYNVDCKTASFSAYGQDQYKARRIDPGTIFVTGNWCNATGNAIVKGIAPGRWLLNIGGYEHGDFFNDGDLMSFEVLPVMLNMQQHRMDYRKALDDIVNTRYRCGGPD